MNGIVLTYAHSMNFIPPPVISFSHSLINTNISAEIQREYSGLIL